MPGEALVHIKQLSLLGMISRLPGSTLHTLAIEIYSRRSTSLSWFHQVRAISLQYQLPHPLVLLKSPTSYSKVSYKKLVQQKITDYWEKLLRAEADHLESLEYFNPNYMSLSKPHPIFLSAYSSSYEIVKATVQAVFLSGRYRTERLSRFWLKNPDGFCLSSSCDGLQIQEDLPHILLNCRSLAPTRAKLAAFTLHYARLNPEVSDIVLTFTNPHHPQFIQFLLDCSSMPQVIFFAQKYGNTALYKLFKVTRAWCYSLHRDRLKSLGRWTSFR